MTGASARNVYTVRSVEELEALAREVASNVQGGDYVLLTGELGAGKTAFTKHLLAHIGVSEPVTSPSFQIMSEYEIADTGTIQRVLHLDLYRLSPEDARNERFLIDIVRNPEAATLVVIEWADRLPEPPKGSIWNVAFDHGTHEHERSISIEYMNTKGVQ